MLWFSKGNISLYVPRNYFTTQCFLTNSPTDSRATSITVKKQQKKLDTEQQTGSKSGKEYIKVVYCHPVYLTYRQSTSFRMPGWINYKLESRLPEEITITTDDMTLMVESEEELKSLLMKVKDESEKGGLKLNIQKTKIMASGPITSWEMDGETMETVRLYLFIYFWLQNHCRWWL